MLCLVSADVSLSPTGVIRPVSYTYSVPVQEYMKGLMVFKLTMEIWLVLWTLFQLFQVIP